MLGSAIALVLLFPVLPLWSTGLLTATDVMLLLAIENPLKSRPVKLFEGIIAALVCKDPLVVTAMSEYLSRFWPC